MRAHVIGEIVDIETRDYQDRNNSTKTVLQLFIKQAGSSARFGADRVDADPSLGVKQGDHVDLLTNVQAKASRDGRAFLSSWALSARKLTTAEVKSYAAAAAA